jgi:hypothetical protein
LQHNPREDKANNLAHLQSHSKSDHSQVFCHRISSSEQGTLSLSRHL